MSSSSRDVRSLARLKTMTDELRLHAVASRGVGIESPERHASAELGRNGRILVVDDRASSYERLAAALVGEHAIDIETDPNAGLLRAAEGNYDLVIVSLALEKFDGLPLCSQIRSLERTRQMANPKPGSGAPGEAAGSTLMPDPVEFPSRSAT
jgi:two-component system cell cycle response regulator